MKILIIFIVNSTCCFTQNDSIKRIDVEFTSCFPIFDSAPQIIGGIDSLQSRLQYPNEALEKGIEGTVYVSLTIDTSGVPSNLKVPKGLGFDCDEEAKRLILTSNYLPAILRGKKIKLQFMIPVKFKLPTKY